MKTSEPEASNNSEERNHSPMRHNEELQAGLDYYIENGLFVFTGEFLLKRGYCCESGCRHCPYQPGE